MLELPVMCYWLRTDFQGRLFEGSNALMAIADDLREFRTICHCGKKATMVLRRNADGTPAIEGKQVQIGGNDTYIALCRKHWIESRAEARKTRDSIPNAIAAKQAAQPQQASTDRMSRTPPLQEGDRSRAICHTCKAVVETRLVRCDLPLRGEPKHARDALAYACTGCGEIAAMPRQDLIIREGPPRPQQACCSELDF